MSMMNANSLFKEDFYFKIQGHRLHVRTLKHSPSDDLNNRPTLVFLHEALGSVEELLELLAEDIENGNVNINGKLFAKFNEVNKVLPKNPTYPENLPTTDDTQIVSV